MAWTAAERRRIEALEAKVNAHMLAVSPPAHAAAVPVPPLPIPPLPVPPAGGTQTVNYQPTLADFPNPGRGIQPSYESTDAGYGIGQPYPVEVGPTTVRRYMYLPLADVPLTQTLLDAVATDLRYAISKGLLYDLRIAYARNQGDAEPPWSRILAHQAQLAPVVNQYAHVLNTLELGMIGPWGEQHSVTASGFNEADQGAAYPKRLQLLRGWLNGAPAVQFVTLRFPFQLFWMIDSGGLTAAEIARTGTYSDQFLEGVDWGGTFKGSWTDTTEIDAQRARLATFNLTHPFRGESNFPPSNTWARAHLADFATFGTGTLRDIQGWTSALTQAQRDEINRRLGYRIRLDSATLPVNVTRGQSVTASFVVTNEGFASPRRPRPLYLEFNGVRAAVVSPDISVWVPGQRTVNATFIVPATATSGPLALWLPDPHPALQAPAYAIRLANADVPWDPATGRNGLRASVTVS